MKQLLLVLFGIVFVLSCRKTSRCGNTNEPEKVLRQELIDFFPYQPGQTIIFKKYSDTNYLNDIAFIADTAILTSEMVEVYDGFPDCPDGYQKVNTYTLKLHNTIEKNKDCIIQIRANYYPGLYIDDEDLSDLTIKFENNEYKLWEFGNYQKFGYDQGMFHVDSIFFNGTNFGKGLYTISYNNKSRIYFNSQYGILKLENDSTKERLEYVQ